MTIRRVAVDKAVSNRLARIGIRSEDFRGTRWELGRALAIHSRPITFVLGAGASLSSGAPTTRAVHDCLERATRMRLGDVVQERLHEIVDEEVRDHLLPLFDDISPNVGYRILAALGRVRRINIVNLNWDDAAQRACHAAGVDYVTFDPSSGRTLEDAERRLPDDRGVLILHAHGTIQGRPRYSILETLPNRPELWSAVSPLLGFATVICGASLARDFDIAHVLQKLAATDTSSPPVWMFARSANEERIVTLPARWTQIISADVDFDDLMIALAEEIWSHKGLQNARWDDLARSLPQVDLPRADDLVEMVWNVRRELLDAHVAALVAKPYAGKTVGALRLAHLRLLMQAPQAELRVSLELQDGVTELGRAARRHDVVLFVDDPFGPMQPASNPRAVDFLQALAAGGGSYAYVASRDSNWTRSAGRLQRDHPGLRVPPRHADQWYDRRSLLRLAAGTAHGASLARRAQLLVERGRATTPPDVIEATKRGHVLSDVERLQDARQLLDADETLALCCVLVRLQELRAAPIPPAEFVALLGVDPQDIEGLDALVAPYEVHQETHWRFVHATARGVTDGYLFEYNEEIERRLLAAPLLPSWVRRTLDAWRLQRGLIQLEDCAIGTEQPVPGDWLAERLGSAPSDAVLREIVEFPELDQWSIIELAYELVRMWGDVEEYAGADLLLRRLLDRPMGAYALLESCLYFQLGADDELWSRVTSKLWELHHDPARRFEALLALDATLWREPIYRPVQTWASATIARLRTDKPEFAFVRFAAGYRAEGFGRVDATSSAERDMRTSWTVGQARVAAALVAWHFAHQSRARAMLHRYSHHEKQWLYQSIFPGRPMPATREILHLADSLIAFEATSGWGFHLLCNLASVTGLDLQSGRARELAEEALARAPTGDAGLVSAVLAYAPASIFRRRLRSRCVERREAWAYEDALADGIHWRDLDVGSPRFRYIHDCYEVLVTMDLIRDLPGGIGRGTPARLAENLWRAAPKVMENSTLAERQEVSRRISRVERGDQRLLAVARGGAHDDPYANVIANWLSAMSSETSDKLIP